MASLFVLWHSATRDQSSNGCPTKRLLHELVTVVFFMNGKLFNPVFQFSSKLETSVNSTNEFPSEPTCGFSSTQMSSSLHIQKSDEVRIHIFRSCEKLAESTIFVWYLQLLRTSERLTGIEAYELQNFVLCLPILVSYYSNLLKKDKILKTSWFLFYNFYLSQFRTRLMGFSV